MPSSLQTRAYPFVEGESEEHEDRVRANWERLGYEYRATRDMIEIWRHPETGHTAEMTTF